MISRRGLLFGAGALLAAPAIVRAESLMKIWVPPKRGLWPTLEDFAARLDAMPWQRDVIESLVAQNALLDRIGYEGGGQWRIGWEGGAQAVLSGDAASDFLALDDLSLDSFLSEFPA